MGLEATVKAGARAMAGGEILDQTTVLGQTVRWAPADDAGGLSRRFQATLLGSVTVAQLVKLQGAYCGHQSGISLYDPLPNCSRYPIPVSMASRKVQLDD